MDCNYSEGDGCKYCKNNQYCILKQPLEPNYKEIRVLNDKIMKVTDEINFIHNLKEEDGEVYLSKSLEELRTEKKYLKQELMFLRRS